MYLVDFIYAVKESVNQLYAERRWQLPMRENEWKSRKEFLDYKEDSYLEYRTNCQLSKEELAILKEFKTGIKQMISNLEYPFGEGLYFEKEKEECRAITLKMLNNVEDMLITCQKNATALKLELFREEVTYLIAQSNSVKENVESDEEIQDRFKMFYYEYLDLRYYLEARHRRRPVSSIYYLTGGHND